MERPSATAASQKSEENSMKMWQVFPYDSKYDILGKRKFTAILSVILIIGSILLLLGPGPKWGIDFQGGTEMILRFNEEISDEEVREAAQEIGLEDALVQRFGAAGENRFLIQTQDVSVVDEMRVTEIREQLELLGDLEYADWTAEQPDRMDLLFGQDKTEEEITEAVLAAGLQQVDVEVGGRADEARYTLRFQDLQNIIRSGFARNFPEAFNPDGGLERLETVGPRAGEQLRNDGIVAMIIALLAILIYIWFRFDIRYSPGAVAALSHDIVIALGLFVVLDIEISLPIVAALLTIIGYSLNDTIVVFDRIRENLDSAGSRTVEDVANEAINQTMSRTLITSFTTLMAVTTIAVVATGLIQDFAMALMIGIVVGTYSSIFVATPVMLKMDKYLQERKEADKLLESEAPEGA